jgi:hypothetical protein
MTGTSLDHIISGFPHPSIPPIIGTPTYETLANLQLHLNANAASVQSNLGDGQLGLLALTVSVAVYNTLSAVQFIAPVNPGPTPIVPVGTTVANAAIIVRNHTSDLQSFREWLATDNALKQQIISAINSMFLRTLSHRITGFANVTTRQMLTHLYQTYGRLNPVDVQDNDARMKEAYDPNQPIEAFIDQIEDRVTLADAAATAYTPAQIIAIAYNLIFATGMFPEACREWRRRPIIEKTWTNFKTDFAIAHQEFRESQVTSNQAGYQQAANAAYTDLQQETADAIANLATATASDRSTVASLTSTNSTLSSEVTQATMKLTAANNTISSLKIEIAALKAGGNQREERTYTPNLNYCWTHGYKVSRRHTSDTCKGKRDGHKDDATRTDNKGGSQRGKEE